MFDLWIGTSPKQLFCNYRRFDATNGEQACRGDVVGNLPSVDGKDFDLLSIKIMDLAVTPKLL
jgi:hypothetical protein